MTEEQFALQIHNDDVTPFEAVIEVLREFGLSKEDALDLAIATHHRDAFIIEFGSYAEISTREQQLQDIISGRSLALKCSVIGPLDDYDKERWLEERSSIRWPAVERIFWVVASVLVAVIGVAYFLRR